MNLHNLRFFSHDHRIWILVIISLLSLFPLLGSAPLFDEDEGYYAEASREMLETGNYLTAHVNGLPEYDKPILIYWLQAFSISVFGLNEFAVRFPSAVATFLWMLAIFNFTRRNIGTSSGFFAALFFISAIQITITGKAAIVDSVLNLFLTLCMFHLYEYLQKRNHQIYYAALYAGLAFLAKGPVAVVIPLGVSLVYCLLQRQMDIWVKMIFNPIAILIFSSIALPWYILEYMDQGMVFIQDFFLKHNLERFSRAFEGHTGSFFYYFPVLIIGTLPHSGLLLPLVSEIRKLFRQDFYRFCLIWIGLVLILFSLAGTKLPHYIMSAFAPLFILYGSVYERMEKIKTYLFLPAFFLVVFMLAPLAIPLLLPYVHDKFAACVMNAATPLFGSDYFLVCAVLASAVIFLFFKRHSAGLLMPAIVVSLAFLVLVNPLLMPRIGKLMQSPVKEAAETIKRKPEPVVMWGHFLPSFMFYSRQFVEIRNPASGDLLITKKTRLPEVGPHEIIQEKNCIVLVRILE